MRKIVFPARTRHNGAVIIIAILLLLTHSSNIFAQPQRPGGITPGAVTGYVWDSDLAAPIEYANVVIYRMRDTAGTRQPVNGTITDAQGKFLLRDVPPGLFSLEISFIGYRTRKIDNIRVTPGQTVDLGRLELRQAAIAVEGQEVVAEKPRLEFRIDKKIINVAQNPALQSGTAVDALEQAPGVKVDVEGNVSLRGLESFTVLIDGRPSPVEGSDALKQIPASTIERIEIVTNPSAKFDPEGKAGIINVILKKQRQQGISGIANLSAGNNGILGGNILLTIRQGISTFYLGPNFNQMNFPGTREVWREVRRGDTSYFNSSTGTTSWGNRFYGLRAGADFQLTPQDWLSLSARFGGRGGTRTQSATYQKWQSFSTDTLTYAGRTYSLDDGTNIFASLNASHNFGKKEHELSLEANYGRNNSQDSTETTDSTATGIINGKRTIETRQGQHLNLKLGFTLPLREKDKFEAGYQSRIRLGPKQTSQVFNYDTATGYQFQPEYSHQSEQKDIVHAFYSTYNGNYHGFGALLGLRTEFSERRVTTDTTSYSPIRGWDIFPSLHLSYSFPKEQQLMASYTRRIDRPRGWDLVPNLVWMDAENVRQGNPDLKPEFIDNYEAGFVLPLGKHRLTLDGYYRITHNVIERSQRVYQGNIMLHTVDNVGTDRALGAELNLDLAPFQWWNINLTGTTYNYRLQLPDTIRKSFNWDAGITTDFTLPTLTRLQLSFNYESPSVTAQGKEGARIRTNVALRQAFFRRQLLLSLAVRDLFGSSIHESTAEGENFSTRLSFRRKSPTISLSLTYNFNNYRQERRRPTGNGEEEEMPSIEYY